jgi:hypothetical protein
MTPWDSSGAVPIPIPPPALLKDQLSNFGAGVKPLAPAPILPAPSVLDQLEARSRREALDLLLGTTTPVPAWGAPGVSTASAVPDPSPVNGGHTAWGGVVIGAPATSTTETLPFQLPRLPAVKIKDDLSALWQGGKWVVKKADKYFLGPLGTVLTAREIYNWAKDHWPSDRPLPARVPTQFDLHMGQLQYEHPGVGWREYPPPGYGVDGQYLWKAH